MSKINSITLRNLKAVERADMTFNGCTVLVTGGNDKGKSTILAGMIDRLKGMKPEQVVRHGEENGIGILELTTGEKFTWEFDKNGKDELKFSTLEGVKGSVTKAIAKKYFPTSFDIDQFLISPPKKQSEMLQKLVNLDFTEIDARYKVAFEQRADANREEYRLRQNLEKIVTVPERVQPVSIDDLVKQKNEIRERLDKKYQENKLHNDKLRTTFQKTKDDIRKAVTEQNEEQDKKTKAIEDARNLLNLLVSLGYAGSEVAEWIDAMPKPDVKQSYEIEIGKLEVPDYITPEKPVETELDEVDGRIIEINKTNEKASEWFDYLKLWGEHWAAELDAERCDQAVKKIEDEKFKMIAGANIPKGIEFTEDGIVIDGYPLSKMQLSKSEIYCAALRLASIGLGEVRTLHFDASPLDRKKLDEIEAWANKNNLQLLIERPDFDNGEIKYQLLEY